MLEATVLPTEPQPLPQVIFYSLYPLLTTEIQCKIFNTTQVGKGTIYKDILAKTCSLSLLDNILNMCALTIAKTQKNC